MARIGISRATVRDNVGATIHEGVRVLGQGDDTVVVHDKTGAVQAVWTGTTVTMLAPDLYQVTTTDRTYLVERTVGGCGCGR
jgi:hypothetical protein